MVAVDIACELMGEDENGLAHSAAESVAIK